MKNRCGQVPLWGEFGAFFAPVVHENVMKNLATFFVFFFRGNPARILFEIRVAIQSFLFLWKFHLTTFWLTSWQTVFSHRSPLQKNPTNGFPHVLAGQSRYCWLSTQLYGSERDFQKSLHVAVACHAQYLRTTLYLGSFTTWLRKWYWLLTRDAYKIGDFMDPFYPG